ncbi:MAG: tetratricopeptide repeat protein [Ignavibacteria bacterium]
MRCALLSGAIFLLPGITAEMPMPPSVAFTKQLNITKVALELKSTDSFTLHNLGNAYEELGEYPTAIKYFSESIMTDSHNYESYYGRGNCYFNLCKYEKALDDFDSALILCKDYSEIWYLKADCEQALGRIEDSLKSYEMVVKLESTNHEAWYDYGKALLSAKMYESALNAFDNVIKNHGFWEDPFYQKAKIHFLKEEIELGIEMLEKGFDLNPADRFDYEFDKDWKKIMKFLINV